MAEFNYYFLSIGNLCNLEQKRFSGGYKCNYNITFATLQASLKKKQKTDDTPKLRRKVIFPEEQVRSIADHIKLLWINTKTTTAFSI